MRLYVADKIRDARTRALGHVGMVVLLFLAIAVPDVAEKGLLLGIAAGLHLRLAYLAYRSSRALARLERGYVDVTPGVIVLSDHRKAGRMRP
jgi:hypothetical protein